MFFAVFDPLPLSNIELYSEIHCENAVLLYMYTKAARTTVFHAVRTFEAGVSGHQIQLEVLGTGRRAVEQLVWDGDAARPSTGTATVGERPHVREAADVAVVAPDAAAILHPAVVGARYDDYLIRLTRDLQLLPLTVLVQPCTASTFRSVVKLSEILSIS